VWYPKPLPKTDHFERGFAQNVSGRSRGLDRFGTQALHAQNAGAKAVIIVKEHDEQPAFSIPEMVDDRDLFGVSIPVYMVSRADGT
jgi:hypothetical protein